MKGEKMLISFICFSSILLRAVIWCLFFLHSNRSYLFLLYPELSICPFKCSSRFLSSYTCIFVSEHDSQSHSLWKEIRHKINKKKVLLHRHFKKRSVNKTHTHTHILITWNFPTYIRLYNIKLKLKSSYTLTQDLSKIIFRSSSREEFAHSLIACRWTIDSGIVSE